MRLTNKTNDNYTPRQLKLPLEIEKLIDISDPVYTFCEVIEANANRYTWVWKKSCTKNRGEIFEKISTLIDAMNLEVLGYLNVKLEKREEYAIDYVSELLEMYKLGTKLEESTFVSGCGHRKSIQQKQYQELQGYLERLKTYAHHIEVCGEERNSYSKTDHDATFMRIKRDYMGNDQLLPAYNLQTAVCDEYIAVVDVKPYASDMECFVPLMEKYMKFTMFKKETTDKKYHENPYRAVNFKRDGSGNLICPNGRKFHFKSRQHVYRNKYGRTEEIFGVLKWDKSYKRLSRRGEKNVILELTLISCGFNLYKYHNKKQRKGLAA